MSRKILVIEDNQDWITLYQDILGEEHQLEVVTCLKDLKALLQRPDLNYDLIISDLKLPDGMFLDWVQETRSDLMERFPTVIASSLEDIEVLRVSFEWGATDYLIKPFRKSELIVKLEKAYRDYKVKNESGSAQNILDQLTSMEAKIFQRFLSTPEELITREKLTMDIWKKVAVHPKTIDVHLSNLRRKLSETEWTISNEHEKGWRLSKIIKE